MGRRFCYNQRVAPENQVWHESARLAHLLTAWDIVPSSLTTEIRADPALAAAADKLLPPGKIICHLASSQPKKEWPLKHWAALHQMAIDAGIDLVFSTGIGVREEALLTDFKQLAPAAPILEPVPDLALYLAVLRRAKAFVSGDTGPLHFAAGLGVPTLALFGPSSPAQWAPVGSQHRFLTGTACICGNVGVCESPNPCLAAITPEQVLAGIEEIRAGGSGVMLPAVNLRCPIPSERIIFHGQMTAKIPYLDLPAQIRSVRKELGRRRRAHPR